MALSFNSPRNPPLKVEFMGFRSDTMTLGRAGWEVRVENDSGRFMRDIALYVSALHPKFGVALIGRLEMDFQPSAGAMDRFEQYRDAVVRLSQIVTRDQRARIVDTAPLRLDYRQIDTEPRYMDISERDIWEMPIFNTAGVPMAEELIVDPETVTDLMERIRQMQAPEQAEIRKNNARRERDRPCRLHANIISLAA